MARLKSWRITHQSEWRGSFGVNSWYRAFVSAMVTGMSGIGLPGRILARSP